MNIFRKSSQVEKTLCKKYGISGKAFGEIRRSFNAVDSDKSGSITVKELGEAIKATGQRFDEKEISSRISEFDKDNSGAIEFEEYVSLVAPKYLEQERISKEIESQFKAFDINKDGFISENELMMGLKSLGEELTLCQVQEIMRDADKDQDGKLCYSEFAAYINCNM